VPNSKIAGRGPFDRRKLSPTKRGDERRKNHRGREKRALSSPANQGTKKADRKFLLSRVFLFPDASGAANVRKQKKKREQTDTSGEGWSVPGKKKTGGDP